ncbi:MAG TPA: HNH endonuclease [Actinomycetota bacterium]|nr:HNH endonuclease [Actinomycetota bacterium]
MIAVESSRASDARRHLSATIDALQSAVSDSPELAIDALRAADRLIASAVAAIARGVIDSAAGLPTPLVLQMDARAVGYEARAMTRTASVLSSMPRTLAAFRCGLLSWSQTRGIVAAIKPCRVEDRIEIDRLIGSQVPSLIDADPDRIVEIVDDEVARRRRDLTERREERAVERSFIAFQPRLGGRTMFYGEGDTASVATLVEALDRAAGAPANQEDDDAPTRAQQRYDALIALAGGSAAPSARPLVLATVDVNDLTAGETAARVLWNLAGRAPRLSPIGTETMLCDSAVLPVVFDNGQPIAVGNTTQPIPRRIRRAVTTRDQGCRFPGCDRPVAWTDAHHIRPRSHGGASTPANLISLCRRCHRRIHKRGWRIELEPDGVALFTHRARRYRSDPATGPPRAAP